ncbi:MAG TPA: hypothetical protein VK465_12860, partial [Fibrobacteria bacterium]|nr:hypothetical protein [Fibrobacteria bacterium]
MPTGKGFLIPSTGTFTPDLTNLYLRLPLGALGPSTESTTFRLISRDEPAFDKTLTMKDDLVEGDEFAELFFEGLFAGGRFTLEVDPGNGKPKATLFKDKTITELTSLDATTGDT